MHARLNARWVRATAPMMLGGWYPVIAEDLYGVTVRVDGQGIELSPRDLELTNLDRVDAIWAMDPAGGMVVVCPEGHTIREGIAPFKPRARCPVCLREYDVVA